MQLRLQKSSPQKKTKKIKHKYCNFFDLILFLYIIILLSTISKSHDVTQMYLELAKHKSVQNELLLKFQVVSIISLS